VPHATEILIQTRWHDDDLAGRALNHEEWRVISLPALAETEDPLGRAPGEPLWCDDDYGYGAHLINWAPRPRRGRGLRSISNALLLRKATTSKEDWLRPCDKLPPCETLKIYGASDYAVTADSGDYTVHIVVGVDPDWRIYVLDIYRAQASSDRWIEAFCDLIQAWKPIGWAEEQGQIRAGVGPFLERRMRERHAYVARKQFPTRGDKAVRAQSIRGRMALDGLYVPRYASWYPALRSELLSFPAGKHDDQVDALGLIGQVLDCMTAGSALPTTPEKIRYMNEMTMDEVWERARSQRPADMRI